MAKSNSRRSLVGRRKSALVDAITEKASSPTQNTSQEQDAGVEPSQAPPGSKRRGSDADVAAEKKLKAASDEAKRIISIYDPESASSIASASSAGYHFQDLLRKFATKQTQRTPRPSIGPQPEDSKEGIWNPVDVEWSIFQDWPQGLEMEEKEMRQYYKYLKFINLEHETKIRFITEVVDDLSADPPREAVVYTPRDVKEREAAMFALKSQLKEAKTVVRALRSEIDDLATRLATPYRQLVTSSAEAKSLLDECMDLELELVKIKSKGGNLIDNDVENLDLDQLPSVGSLTEHEAIRFLERQEDNLTELEDLNSQLETSTNTVRLDLKERIKTVDRLHLELNSLLKQVQESEPQSSATERDVEMENRCENLSSQLNLLKGLIGLKSIEKSTRGENGLRLKYTLPSDDGFQICLDLFFDQPTGGRISSIELVNPLEPKSSPISVPASTRANSPDEDEFASIIQAIQSNDVAAVIINAWSWAERKVRIAQEE
ncbi:unnamed protein product [Sympodiomycopsis kandeliae]